MRKKIILSWNQGKKDNNILCDKCFKLTMLFDDSRIYRLDCFCKSMRFDSFNFLESLIFLTWNDRPINFM